MSASPIPWHEVSHLNLGRGWRWYLLVGDRVRGGPYASETEAEAARDEQLREISDLYEAVEADARENGYRVAW